MTHLEIVEAVTKWLKIREDNGKDVPKSSHMFFVDADHSSLLHRLLDGKEPFPEPPPLALSRPWYSLIEEGKGTAYEAWKDTLLSDTPQLMVNQFPWDIVEELGDGAYIVTPIEGRGPIGSKWHVYPTGEMFGGSPMYKIERMDSE